VSNRSLAHKPATGLKKTIHLTQKTGGNMTTPTHTNLITLARRQLGKRLARLSFTAAAALPWVGSLTLESRRRRNLRLPKNEESIHSMRFGVGAASVIAAGLLCVAIPPARATSVYSQNFNSGSATFTANDPFWLDNNRANGFITQTTNTNTIWPGAPGQFSTDITSDVSGNGYFLFDGTYLYNGTTSPTIPVGSDEFFISPAFSVATNTNYTVSYYLTDANGISPPSVQPQINGALLGSPVSPVGTFGSNGWQQFSFSWNSGANTSASLILHDFNTSTAGNDFGLDNIDVSSVPEPSSLAFLGVGSLAALSRRRRKLAAMIIPVIGLALLTAGTARANFVTNGGFELYTGSAPKDYFSNVLPTDWSGGLFDTIDAPGTADAPFPAPGLPVYPGFPATSPAGGNFEQSDSTPTLALPVTQTINSLTVGQSYTLSFYQAAGQELGGTGATTDQWQVSLGAQTQMSSLMSVPQGGMSPWATQTMTFTPSSTSELLSFVAIGTGGVPPQIFLDGVDMESNVPEPSAALLLGGVGGVIAVAKLVRRLRAKRTAVVA
jgi:PEP-CTERM motif